MNIFDLMNTYHSAVHPVESPQYSNLPSPMRLKLVSDASSGQISVSYKTKSVEKYVTLYNWYLEKNSEIAFQKPCKFS